jgi:hypothetical protein
MHSIRPVSQRLAVTAYCGNRRSIHAGVFEQFVSGVTEASCRHLIQIAYCINGAFIGFTHRPNQLLAKLWRIAMFAGLEDFN